MEDIWFIYVIECRDKKLYVGIAKDVNKRVQLHNKGLACRFTKYRYPVKLLCTEKYFSKSSARIREIELKGFSREKKLNIIQKGSSSALIKPRTDSESMFANAHIGPIV